MNVSEVIKKRRSIREFRPEPIPEKILRKILEAARLSPSAHNAQNWKFIVVRDAEKRKKLAEAAGQDFIGKAPVIIALVSLEPDDIMSCDVPTYAVDLAIAGSYMTLQAWEENIGTCWIGAFSQSEVKKILGVPAQYKVVTMLPFGFPAESPSPRTRKKLEEIVSFEKF
jgi:nitroreductase